MFEPGAMVIGDNVTWRPEFSGLNLTGSGWEHADRLLTPQLYPKCVRSGDIGSLGVEVMVSSELPRAPNVFALLGVVGGSLDNLKVDQFDKAWEGITDYEVLELNSVYNRHLVVVLHGGLATATGWRVRWSGSTPVEIGSVYVGRRLAAPDLADQGWSQEYHDLAGTDVSEGGQQHADDTSTHRIVRIPQGTVNPLTQLGVLPHGQLIAMGAPSVSGSAGQLNGGIQFGVLEGTVTWNVTLSSGKTYRFDYLTQEEGASSEGSPRISISGTGYQLLFGRNPLPTGRHSIVFRRTATTTTFALAAASALGQGNLSRVWPLALSEVEDPGVAPWVDQLMEDNMQSFLARHGTSRPIVAMLTPSDPMRNRVTGIYGTLREPVRATDLDGQYTQSAMVIREQR